MPETKEFQHQKYYFFAQHGKQVKLFHHYVTEVPQRGDTFDTLESSHHTEWTIIKIPSRHQAKKLNAIWLISEGRLADWLALTVL